VVDEVRNELAHGLSIKNLEAGLCFGNIARIRQI